MDSYEGFARRFDRLIDWKRRCRREEPFFRKVLPAGTRRILDCHCGTGFHCAMLAEMGYEAEGVDASPHMLKIAWENLAARGLRVPLRLGDVKEMPAENDFDCVLSMGNSLPHEFGDENLLGTLRRMYGSLHDGGLCVIHTENFDRLYQDRDRFIPSRFVHTERGTETFIFAIDYYEDQVVFNVLSIIEENGLPEFNVDVVKYNPVTVEKMKNLMTQAGFRDIKVYGDFEGTPVEESDSYDAIYVARK